MFLSYVCFVDIQVKISIETQTRMTNNVRIFAIPIMRLHFIHQQRKHKGNRKIGRFVKLMDSITWYFHWFEVNNAKLMFALLAKFRLIGNPPLVKYINKPSI